MKSFYEIDLTPWLRLWVLSQNKAIIKVVQSLGNIKYKKWKVDWTWSNLIKLDRTWSNVIKCDRTWLNLIECNGTWSNMIKRDQAWLNVIKREQMWSNLNELDWTWTKMIELVWIYMELEWKWSSQNRYIQSSLIMFIVHSSSIWTKSGSISSFSESVNFLESIRSKRWNLIFWLERQINSRVWLTHHLVWQSNITASTLAG